ncbi:sorting nexin-14-like isoform X3 [Babylonia areolata]|uniref:sorting nexin-14-like isoform X3 n=1 Tax=Babylonia areolata TaxID=304850 RepID=UPI003FD10E5D
MIPWYLVKLYLQQHTKFAAGTAALLVFTLVYYSYFHLFLAAWCFVMGVAVAYSCFSPETMLPNLLMYTRHRKRRNTEDELTLMRTVCRVCGQKKCPRHRPELNILAFQPWTSLEIPQKVDDALEEFLSLVLKEFVYTWYKDLSLDEEFVDELRTDIRFLASVLFRRMRKVDVAHLVTHKLAKVALQHVDAVVQVNRDLPHDSDLQQATLDYLGSNVHCAMWSRKAELEYLRRLTESLFPYILRPQALNSKSTCAMVREILCGSVLLPAMDAIANPDMVNNLLLIFLDNTPPPVATEPPSPRVQFLTHFSQAQATNQSCLRLELNDVTNAGAPHLLYPFMQFLKSEAAVNVLQFCLSCEDFNKQILSPDVSQSEFVALHNAAKDLYRTYVAPDALDRIKFDEDVVTELKDIVDGPPDQVIRLRTSTPLFKAYEHAYDLLQHTFLPMFHQSDDYYLMLCGDRPNSSASRQLPNSLQSLKNNNSRASRKKDFGFSNLGSKIKDVFRSNSEDRAGGDFEVPEGPLGTVPPMGRVEEEMSEEVVYPPGSDEETQGHDLSSWRVTIPRTGVRPDPDNPRKHYYVFIIDVRRVDVQEGDREKCSCWTVARQYPEFYVLEQKLTEFHGEFEDCQLPPKKTTGTKNQEFTESRKDVLEQYLQKLLTKPHLKGSQLLYNFLTSENEFTSSFLPDIKLGKLVKSVPMKLVKEKGQHLDPFLVNFEKSTEAPKPKPSKPERRGSDVSLISTSSEKMVSGLYENNANSGFAPPLNRVEKPSEVTTYEVEGFFDSLIYFAREVYGVPEWVHHTLVTLRMLLKNTVESYLDGYLDNKVAQVTQEHRVVSLVHLLRDVLFFDTDPPRTDEQKKRRYEEALNGFIDFIPSYVASVVGSRRTVEGSKFLVDVFQKPKLNKQLSYVMLDIVITELFPELKENLSPLTPPRSPR